MVGSMLMRGMLVGILAGFLSFCFLRVAGEPAIDRAIAFEAAMDAAKDRAKTETAEAKPQETGSHDATAHGAASHAASHGASHAASHGGSSQDASHPAMAHDEAEQELVSRDVQGGLGLLTGVTVYSTAFGGLFALVFALCYGRMGNFGARTTAGLLALSGIVAVYVVPSLKYPANPPAVGNPDTLAARTELFFVMIALSLAAMIAAWMIRNRLALRFGGWNAAIIAAGAYLVVMAVAGVVLPGVNEVPEAFPAAVLWQFRIASFGAQAIMWATIGLGFGAVMERSMAARDLRLRLRNAT